MRLVLPPPLADRAPVPFPWMGALAPVLASGVLFAITRSPFALAFAALGPIMAVASLLDGRLTARRARRAAMAARADALAQLSVDIADEHSVRRRRLEALAPRARELLALDAPPIDRRASSRSALSIRLGSGEVPSGISLDPQVAEDRPIARAAARLNGAPISVDPRGGIGLVGSAGVTRALERTVVAQLLWHGVDDRESGPVLLGATVASVAAQCEVVVEVDGPRTARIVRAPDPDDCVDFVPELLSAEELTALRQRGKSGRDALPRSVALRPLLQSGGDRSRIAAGFAVSASGVLPIDLVADGPHALIGGTTGSGKSELLLAWLLAIASAYPADQVGMLLFDFKGGSSFDSIEALPHVRGLVTDLDGRTIDRAAASLAAEMRRRESALRARGARSIEACPELGRLVIAVDEFAALLEGRAELHDVFADVAARGRSLGMHLVLCTQRPTGVMRDSLLANCGLRVSLRVVTAADSTAMIGSDAAARIPRSLPGRCLITLHGESPVEAQVAYADDDEINAIVTALIARDGGAADLVSDGGWLPPLPERVALEALMTDEVDADTVVLGVADLPAEGRQPLGRWRASRDGALAVIGAPGSGRSQAAATIAVQLGVPVLRGADDDAGEQLWDALTSDSRAPLVIDDLDLALDRLSDEHLAALPELMPSTIRARGRAVVVTAAAPLGGVVRSLVAPFGCQLVLRVQNRDDHVLAGAPPALFESRLPAGAGTWKGQRLQIAVSTRPPVADRRRDPQTVRFSPGTTTLVISTSPATRLDQLRQSGVVTSIDLRAPGTAAPHGPVDTDVATVLVTDPESWQSSTLLWPLLHQLDTVYDGCTSAQFRMVSRQRSLPPALDHRADRVWLARPEQPVVRARAIWTDERC